MVTRWRHQRRAVADSEAMPVFLRKIRGVWAGLTGCPSAAWTTNSANGEIVLVRLAGVNLELRIKIYNMQTRAPCEADSRSMI